MNLVNMQKIESPLRAEIGIGIEVEIKKGTGRRIGGVIGIGIETKIGIRIRIRIRKKTGSGKRIVIGITGIVTETEVREGRGPETGMMMMTITEAETMTGKNCYSFYVLIQQGSQMVKIF